MRQALQHTRFTSPWKGEVGERSELGGGDLSSSPFTPPRLAFGQSTLPLQGRVKRARSEP
jgi:hypothetical protein